MDKKIYVRFNPDSVKRYSGNIINTTTGADDVEVSVSGTGISPVIIPDAPTLTSPDSGSTDQSIIPKLNWNTVNGAESYSVHVSTDINFSNLIINQSGINKTEYQIQLGVLSYNTKYYWRVNASNIAGTSGWSNIWFFTTEDEPLTIPNVPTLISPSNGSINQPLNLKLDWNDAEGATSYRMQISKDFDFATLILDSSNLSGSEYIVPQGKLENSTLYYWRVNASNSAGPSAWSAAWSFSTEEEETFTEMNISLARGGR